MIAFAGTLGSGSKPEGSINRRSHHCRKWQARRAFIEVIMNHQLPEVGFVRLSQILGNAKKGIPPIIPVQKSCWWAGVKSGRFPQPIKLGARVTAWRVEDIRTLIATAKG